LWFWNRESGNVKVTPNKLQVNCKNKNANFVNYFKNYIIIFILCLFVQIKMMFFFFISNGFCFVFCLNKIIINIYLIKKESYIL